MKLLSTILSLIFFFASSGLNISVHYCGGSAEDISLFSKGGSCGCEDGPGMPGCCSDQVHTIKIQDQFVKSSLSFNSFDFALLLPVLVFHSTSNLNSAKDLASHFQAKPPAAFDRILAFSCPRI